jgi:transcription antitermination factor NusG|tara:strand:- start:394 stop:792 length:399 start_codon:yes stop_codon:yes gene_type:complete
MIEQVKKSFKVRITESFYDGFRGNIPEKNFSNCIVRDNKALNQHIFQKNDTVTVTVELVDKIKPDVDNTTKVIFYVVVYLTATNGFYTKEYKKGENPHRTILFYKSRGMLTSPRLNDEDFEVGEFVKVTVKK